jgi:biopolymer transport protein ExbB/TolQ
MPWLLANWKLVAAGGVFLVIAGFLWSWDSRGDRVADLEREAEGWNNAITTLKAAVENNDKAIKECEAINAANAAEDARVKDANAAAVANVEASGAQTDTDIRGFHDEADTIRGTDTT